MLERQENTLSQESRDVRLGRLVDEFLKRRAAGKAVDAEGLIARHPELGDDLRAMLAVVGDLRPESDRIASLIRQGTLTACPDSRYVAEFGAYKIVGYLGRGGMGIVLEAREESLDRTVALKILRPELAEDISALARFEREAKAAAALRHPNIVTVYAVGREGDTPFIAMEYVSGASLANVIRTGRGASGLSPELVRSVFRQLLEALSAAHGAGLIHRDVKPSNILLVDIPGRAAGFSLRGAARGEAEHAAQRRRGASVMTARAEARGSSVMKLDKSDTRILESSPQSSSRTLGWLGCRIHRRSSR